MDQHAHHGGTAPVGRSRFVGNGAGLRAAVLSAVAVVAAALVVLLAIAADHVAISRRLALQAEQRTARDAAQAVAVFHGRPMTGAAGWQTPFHPPVPRGNPGAWFGADDYPPDARRAGAEGRTVVELLIQADGRASDCRVVSGSGNASLDRATCLLALQRGRFAPGRDREERAVVSVMRMPGIRWQLEN
ncbi:MULTISPECIES: energy transducer TonB [unclassified Sphingomonas]|uniref:energy transducer TonB n=1 Tax=unclassified Sphingomonas TaxID=196159 RepID=UPI0022698D86|nr:MULTISPECIES: energy transducer TonB [unclassified Sphingomonas]